MSISLQISAALQTLLFNGVPVLTVSTPAGSTDRFEHIGENMLRWTRKRQVPVEHMRMTLRTNYEPTYFQIPAVNYNGNGWGSGAQYSGYRCGDTPWSYAWHRVSIPACTYSECDRFAVALFGEETGGMSCSIYTENGTTVQELIWPEVG